MFKVNNDWDASLKHLHLALFDSSPSTFSKLESTYYRLESDTNCRYRTYNESGPRILLTKCRCHYVPPIYQGAGIAFETSYEVKTVG